METSNEKYYSFTLYDKKNIALLDTFLKALNIKNESSIKMTKEEFKRKIEKAQFSKKISLSLEEENKLFE